MTTHKTSGFTLIEVLMSMLIFSTAILGLLKISTENIKNTALIEQKQIAGIVADNVLIAQISRTPDRILDKQNLKKMAGREWRWRVETQPTERANFFRITVNVYEQGQPQLIVSRFAIVRRKPAETL